MVPHGTFYLRCRSQLYIIKFFRLVFEKLESLNREGSSTKSQRWSPLVPTDCEYTFNDAVRHTAFQIYRSSLLLFVSVSAIAIFLVSRTAGLAWPSMSEVLAVYLLFGRCLTYSTPLLLTIITNIPRGEHNKPWWGNTSDIKTCIHLCWHFYYSYQNAVPKI